MKFNKRTAKRIKNLEKFCTFDMENKTATLSLHFNNVIEVLDQRVSVDKEPVICTEAINTLENSLDMIPREFKVNFEITIADYQEYNSKMIQDAYLEAIERQKYKQQLSSKKQQSKIGKFVALGLFFLLPAFLNTKYSWFTLFGLRVSALIAFFLEIAADLLLEEGIVYFIITRVADKFSLSNRHRIGTIRLY